MEWIVACYCLAEAPEVRAREFFYGTGCGKDGSSQNKLGQILMEVREILRQRK